MARSANSLLVNIVRVPVSSWRVVPFAFGSLRVVFNNDEILIEARDEVDATDDVVRVKEPKSAILHVRNELDPVEVFCFPTGLVLLVDPEPVDPEHIHVSWVNHQVMEHLDSIDCQNVCINVWVERVLRECHHVRTTFHIDLVLPSLEVIAGVIHDHHVLLFEAVTCDEYFVAVVLCKHRRFFIVLMVKDPSKKVVLEVWNKVLGWVSQPYTNEGWCVIVFVVCDYFIR